MTGSDFRLAALIAVICGLSVYKASNAVEVRAPEVGGLGSVCSIQLAHFCVTPTGSMFLVSVVQKAVDFEGLIYFVEGIGWLDKSQRFAVVIRDLKTGASNLKGDSEFCRTFGLSSSVCERGPLASVTLKFQERYLEAPALKAEEGIRIDVVEAEGVPVATAESIAVPCQFGRDRRFICGKTLPVCQRSATWVGCDTQAGK